MEGGADERLKQLQRSYSLRAHSTDAILPVTTPSHVGVCIVVIDAIGRSTRQIASRIRRSCCKPGSHTNEVRLTLQEGHGEQLGEHHVKELFTSGIYNEVFICGHADVQRLPIQPLHVIEMERAPAGLVRSRTIVRPPECIPWNHVQVERCLLFSHTQTSKRGHGERVQYGAWYIPPKEWKVHEKEVCFGIAGINKSYSILLLPSL